MSFLRERPGAREVQWTWSIARGGNLLYFWQWAHLGTAAGQRRSVLRTEHMSPWLAEFPVLDSLTVTNRDVSFLDRRVLATRHHYGTSFTRSENIDFCRFLLSQTPGFAERVEAARSLVTDQTCVVNVRRGDYYSVPAHEREFGLDIRQHVSDAVDLLRDTDRELKDILVVSDDPAWCAANLHDVLPQPMRFVTDRRDMFDDLAVLSASRTLILANSTFSYWGSFLASAQRPDHLAVAPSYHQRTHENRVITDLFDPHWLRTGDTDVDRDVP